MYSFDVFDTLITRSTATPEGIFLLMQRYLEEDKGTSGLSDRAVREFPSLRIDAERNARRFQPKTEIRLEQIYDAMGRSVRLSSEDKSLLMGLEERCELACAVGVGKNIRALKRLIARGEKVLLLSDMYLPADTIRRMLVKVDKVFEGIPLYVSCEHGVTKSSGLLYALVHEREHVGYAQWVHCGDNRISDVNVPRLYGIRTKRVPILAMRPWERAMADHLHLGSDLMLQLMLGVSRRLSMEEESGAYQVGASCAPLILIPYVLWVIRSAQEMGITRLYFVARDGFLLKKIADIYIDEDRLDIETGYLYGSRQAWGCEDPDGTDMLLRYLRQELPAAGSSFGLVDTHGTGRSVSRIAGLLKVRIKAFYYDLLESPYRKDCDLYVYSADIHDGMLEALCRAPHGVTLGYTYKGDTVVPRLAELSDKVWERCGLDAYIRGAEDFARGFFAVCKDLQVDIRSEKIGRQMLRYCWETPDDIVAGFIGEMPHDSGNRERGWRYAPMLDKKDISRIALVRTDQDLGESYHGDDFRYSYKRLSERDKRSFDRYERYYRGAIGSIMHTPRKKVRELLGRRKRIKVILYAAGRYGKELYHRMRYAEGIDIVAWVDVDHRTYQEQQYPVSPIYVIREQHYDLIVIALDSIPISEMVRDMLISAGVEKEKIRFKDEFMRDLL